MGGLEVQHRDEVGLLAGGVDVGHQALVGDADLLDDALALQEHGEDVLEHALVAGRIGVVFKERKKELFAGGEELGAMGLFFFAAFLDLAGPATEEDAVGLERGRLITKHVAALDVTAERLEDDARHEVADVEFLAGSGADACDGFNLPVHDH